MKKEDNKFIGVKGLLDCSKNPVKRSEGFLLCSTLFFICLSGAADLY